jgi:hypothetical protein
MVGVAILLGFLAMNSPRQSTDPPKTRTHNDLSCSECHAMAASNDTTASPENHAGERCRDCHVFTRLGGDDIGKTFHYDENRPCTDCHSFHQTEIIRAAGAEFRFDYDNTHLSDHCHSCHDAPHSASWVGSGHREAAQVYHRDSRYLSGVSLSDACLYCHSGDAAPMLELELPQTPPKFNPFGGHVFGVRMSVGGSQGGYSERFPDNSPVHLVERKIECQSCHDLSADNNHLLAGTGQYGDLCLACHVRNKA